MQHTSSEWQIEPKHRSWFIPVGLLIHCLLPVVMVFAWVDALGTIQRNWDIHTPRLWLIVCGVLAVYTGDRVVFPSSVIQSIFISSPFLKRILWALALGGAVCCVYCSFLVGVVVPLGVLVGVTVFQPLWKRIPLGKTIAVSFAWCYACHVMVFQIPLYTSFSSGTVWIMMPVFMAACLLCDYKDKDDDKQSGVRSLHVIVGDRAVHIIVLILLLSAGSFAWDGQSLSVSIAVVVLLILAHMPRVLSRPLLGPIVVDAALCLPILSRWFE